MFKQIGKFFATGPDAPRLQLSREELRKKYEFKRWSVFIGITVGYVFYYFNRLGWSVVKKPIVDEGILNMAQCGKIGAIMLMTYGLGKFFNGFLGDWVNIRKFLSFGLLCTALLNLLFGQSTMFWMFFVIWALNGWFQATGAGPCVVTLSQWFAKKERGTLYGIWSGAHALGELLVFTCLSAMVMYHGWRSGFGLAGVCGIAMAIIFFFMLSDRPETYGLPNIKEYKEDMPEEQVAAAKQGSLLKQQLEIMRYPAIWAIGLASFFNYVTRYGINSWGVPYLQETRGDNLVAAGFKIAVNTVPGLAGAMLCGLISDRFFNSNRHKPMLLYGLLQIFSLIGFFYLPKEYANLSIVCLGAYGFAMGGTLAYLGGLTAIDLVPRRVAGAAMGFIGLISYMGASAQDWLSGHLLEQTKVKLASGGFSHNYDKVILVWIGASVISLILAMTVWNVKNCED